MEIHQQIPPGMDGRESPFNRILEKASSIVRRCKETAGDVEPAEGYKRRQITALKEFSSENNLYIDFQDLDVIYLDKGGENEVFYDGHASVFKLNNFDYAGDDLTNFFNNIPYSLIGFSENSRHEFCAVLIQPYIPALREATPKEIMNYMQQLGFTMDFPDEFHNNEYEIFDAVPNNVLYGKDNILYFIDTQIRKRIE